MFYLNIVLLSLLTIWFKLDTRLNTRFVIQCSFPFKFSIKFLCSLFLVVLVRYANYSLLSVPRDLLWLVADVVAVEVVVE